jgi:hypothetical protein
MKNKMTTNGILLYALKKTYPDAEIVAVDSSNKKGEEMDKILGVPYVLSIKNKTNKYEIYFSSDTNKNLSVKFTSNNPFGLTNFADLNMKGIEQVRMEVVCKKKNLSLQLCEPLMAEYKNLDRVKTTVICDWHKRMLSGELNVYYSDVNVGDVTHISIWVHPKTKIYLMFYPKVLLVPVKRKV